MVILGFFFFCKQKTAYEMRISDWSSDVCSSDLARFRRAGEGAVGSQTVARPAARDAAKHDAHPRVRRSYVPRAAAGQDQLLHEVYGRGRDLGRLDDGDRPDRYGFPELSPARQRSEERRIGKGGVSTSRFRWSA